MEKHTRRLMENGMKYSKVEDSSIIEQLNKQSTRKVTDPEILSKLNGESTFQEPEEEGFFHKLPRNIIAGLANLGHSTMNTPHDVAQNLENQGQGIGNIINKGLPIPKEFQEKLSQVSHKNPYKVSEHIPYQQDYNFAQMLGQSGEGTLMDKLIQKGTEYSPELLTGRALIRAGLHKFPITKSAGTRQLKEAERLVGELGVPNIPINVHDLFEAEQYLPKTLSSREMLSAASKGEYKPSFALQSQLGHHERNLAKSPLASERLISPEVSDLRQNIISQMDTGLRSHGYHDIADMLKGGINDYRKYIKFKNAVTPVLKKVGIPATALGIVSFGINKARKTLSNIFD